MPHIKGELMKWKFWIFNISKLNCNILLRGFDIIKKKKNVELWKVHIKLKCILIMCKYSTYESFNLARCQELLRYQNYWWIF